MSAKIYDPMAPWSTAALAMFIEARERRGYHIIYKNGLVRGDYEVGMNEMGRLINGWTARVFLFRPSLQSSFEIHVIADNYHYCKVQVVPGASQVKIVQMGYDPAVNQNLGPTFDEGEICSVGIRWRDPKYFTGVCNDKESSWMNMDPRRPPQFRFKIWHRSCITLSIHLTGELKEPYIPIRTYFNIPYQKQPPGSSIVAVVKVFDASANVRVGFDLTGDGEKGVSWLNYEKPFMKNNMEFHLYIRHLPGYYAVQTSFDPKFRKTLTKTPSRDNIWLYISDKCETLHLTHYVVGFSEPIY